MVYQPGLLFVAATFLPLASFLFLLGVGAKRFAARRYRDQPFCAAFYQMLGGDVPPKWPAYVATGAIAAAFIQKQDYYAQSGWRMEVLGDEKQYAIETYETPKSVETACTAIWKGNRLMTPVGGGVQMGPTRALQTDVRLKDDKGTVKQAHDSVKLDNLAQGQWWWD